MTQTKIVHTKFTAADLEDARTSALAHPPGTYLPLRMPEGFKADAPGEISVECPVFYLESAITPIDIITDPALKVAT